VFCFAPLAHIGFSQRARARAKVAALTSTLVSRLPHRLMSWFSSAASYLSGTSSDGADGNRERERPGGSRSGTAAEWTCWKCGLGALELGVEHGSGGAAEAHVACCPASVFRHADDPSGPQHDKQVNVFVVP